MFELNFLMGLHEVIDVSEQTTDIERCIRGINANLFHNVTGKWIQGMNF